MFYIDIIYLNWGDYLKWFLLDIDVIEIEILWLLFITI